MTNIHDWCISRQLWWGHRIPAWYCDACDTTLVSEETPSVCSCGGELRQETDVLDTWFSSGLWPFSTMGWPDATEDLERYYPTSLLMTAHDIIFFWVARMMMLGVKFAGDVPFRKVYITSLVRDAHGQKMSKSKGNVVDPLELIGEIGADAFRFTLAALASPGMDISLSEGRLRGYRQFVNKIWNASRFVLLNLPETLQTRPDLPPLDRLNVVHRWMLHRTSELAGDVDDALQAFRFDIAADRLYHVFWHEYADWYIELVKPYLQADGDERSDAVAVLLEVHDRILRMLHPFIPFVTEEIWQALPQRPEDGRAVGREQQTITLASFPAPEPAWRDDEAAAAMGLIQDVVTAIRTVRSEWGVSPSQKVRAIVEAAPEADEVVLRAQAGQVVRLARLTALEVASSVPRDPDTVRRVVRGFQVHVPLGGIVDRDKETERVRKSLAKLVKQRGGLQARLSNTAFVERADPEVVKEARGSGAGDRSSAREAGSDLGGVGGVKVEPFGPLDPALYREIVRRALAEDLRWGDSTTEATIPADQRAEGAIIVGSPCVLAGLEVAVEAFTQLDPHVVVTRFGQDGARCVVGDTVAKFSGFAAALLTAERTALNFLQQMTGTATLTRQFLYAVDGRAVVLDTRKTTPTLRALDKYAVRAGGGVNHRMALDDGILIKDNHIRLVGSIREAVVRARRAGHDMPIEVEAQTLVQVEEAVAAGADIVMADNLTPTDVHEAVRLTRGSAKLEVSGGVTLDAVGELVTAGPEFVSVGALTHSAAAVDFSFDVHPLIPASDATT